MVGGPFRQRDDLPGDQGHADLAGRRRRDSAWPTTCSARADGAEVRRQQVRAADGRKLRQTIQPAARARDRHARLVRRRSGAGNRPAPASRGRPTATTSSRTTRSARPTTRTSGRRPPARRSTGSSARPTASSRRRPASDVQSAVGDGGMVPAAVLRSDRGGQHAAGSAADFTPFQVANPLGNGEMITIYNLNPAKRGQVEILDYNSDTNTHISNDFEFSFNSRLPNGSTVFGGWTASERGGDVRPGQPERLGCERPVLRHHVPARRTVLRRARGWTSRTGTTSRSPARCRCRTGSSSAARS